MPLNGKAYGHLKEKARWTEKIDIGAQNLLCGQEPK